VKRIAFGGHAIEIRRGDVGRAVATEIAVAEIIGHDEDDVRTIGDAAKMNWSNRASGERGSDHANRSGSSEEATEHTEYTKGARESRELTRMPNPFTRERQS
jgi:hypothetical protein